MKVDRQLAFYGAITALWVSVLTWAVWPTDPPIEYLSGDSVIPQVVNVGGTITVTRRYRVLREEAVTVIRTLVRGDCSISCEVVDLPSSTVTMPVQEFRVQSRDMTLPKTVEPGSWRVVFFQQWRDRIGRVHSSPIPVLRFTVVD